MGIIARLILLLSLILCPPAFASCGSRGFGPTFGAGTTDQINTGLNQALASTMTYSAWFWINGIGGGGAGGKIINQANGAALTESGSGLLEFVRVFSGGAGAWSFTTPANGGWHQVVATYNGSSTSNLPTVYIDGTSVSVTLVTAPIGTVDAVSNIFEIGNNVSGIANWDGKLADVAMWNVILTANEAYALGKGASPLEVRPGSLQLYLPLCGVQSNEPDWASHGTQTITGTAKLAGPPNQPYPLMKSGQ